MSKERDTIPEVFRRALEEYEWREEEVEGGQRPPRAPRQLGCGWWVPLLLLGLLFFSLDWIVNTYTEWLWFTEMGYEGVWLKQWGVQLLSFVAFFVVALLFLLGNWQLARRVAQPTLTVVNAGPQAIMMRGLGILVGGAALLLALFFASVGSAAWEMLLRYVYQLPFGSQDPVFGLDLSFYLFELPLYQALRGWLMGLLFVTAVGVALLYALGDWRTLQEQPLRLLSWRAPRRHLALLGALFFALWALGYWLDGYELLFSPRGVIFGAGYTDLNASLMALRVQMVLMGLLALAVGANVAIRNSTLPIVAGGLWLLAGIGLGALYPSFVQRYQVEPNELAREAPYIEHNIALTRQAFALDQIVTQPFTGTDTLNQADLDDNESVLSNIRLWDDRPLKATYSQLQELRPYYTFTPITIDRYEIDGMMRQVMLAARELDKRNLTSPSWVNQKLEFTHGYGIVMNPVDRVSPEGQPEFFISDLPPRSKIELEVTRPEIYFGLMANDEVFVRSGLEEFDYPSGNENVYSRYEGTGGVELGSLIRRLAFAFRFGEANLLLSQYITPETRVLLHRQVQERVEHITPFLALDEPYLVVADGRLVWMVDAYTLSPNFPYATPIQVTGFGRFNYIRNAAKVTIDAYDGDVNYYLTAPEDPLVQAYAAAFPGLFQPLSDMPPTLAEHIRYPQRLFEVQTQQYLTYHMTDVQVFYNKEDLWELPLELFDNNQPVPVAPYYVISSLPGESEPEFLLIQPYVPRGKNNMIAWIAARNDPENYGQLFVYELPKQELIFGPMQIESRIDQDPTISQQITLWSQRGSQVIRGNLLVIPLNDSFLYVEPLYLQSENSALPELKRVIVANGNRIVMRETLGEALTALVEGAPPAVVEGGEPEAGAVQSADELIRAANDHYEAAQEALRLGDWATYGQEQEALGRTLTQLMELTGESAPPPPDE